MRLLGLACALAVAACAAPPPPAPYTLPPKVTHDGTNRTPPPPPPPTGPEQEYTDLAATLAAKMTAIAEVLSPAARDCPVVVTELYALAPRFAGTAAAVAKITSAGRARILGYALEKHAAAVDTAARAILASPTLAACKTDPQFLTAFDAAWAL